jgi:DNA-binding winged helix-turn-helix (wHTH) protein
VARSLGTINQRVLVLSAPEVWINGYLINFKRAEIKVDSTIINVEPKVLAVLIQLYNANGEIVSQSALMTNVWADVVVSPNTLQRCITLLRKLLGDDAKQQAVIKTHPKLGYSLNPQSLIKNQKITPLNSFKQNKGLLFGLIIIVLLIPIILYTQLNSSQNLPSLSQIKPLTTNGHSVHDFTVSHSGKFSVIVRQQQGFQQLIYKELTNQKETVLIDSLQIKGNVALSLDDQTLAFGLQVKKGNKKCVKLVYFDLMNQKIKPLTSCQERFSHSPQWIDNQHLVYLSSNSNRTSDVYLYDTKQQTKSRLTPQHQNTAYLSYQTVSHKLAWITTDGQLSISTLDLSQKKLIELTKSRLPNGLEAASKLHWHNDKTLLIPHKKEIYWFEFHELVKQQKIMTNSRIIDLVSFNLHNAKLNSQPKDQPLKFIALFSQKDTSVRSRRVRESNSLDIDISPSVLSESNGKYRPDTNDIGLLSNKSGSRQLWLASTREDKKLTEVDTGIEQFVWLNKEQIVYLSDQKLWLLTLSEEPILLTGSFYPVRLYQAESEHLLLSVNIDNKAQLIWFNVKTKQFATLLEREVYWAQRMNNNLFISSEGAGKLEIYRDGNLSQISALPPLTIQSGYVWRDNHLYLQDKKLNIWRYDPINEVAEVIGKYDINSLFMSDFKPATSTIVTDNFVSEQRDLVWLSE